VGGGRGALKRSMMYAGLDLDELHWA
jgi:hypothetical protein